jgi:hypothetical protein
MKTVAMTETAVARRGTEADVGSNLKQGPLVVVGLVVALTIAHWSASHTPPVSIGPDQLPETRSELHGDVVRQHQLAKTRDYSMTLATSWSEQR